MIAGAECEVINSTVNKIVCATGSYSFSTIKALVIVSIDNIGEAINVNFFKYKSNINFKILIKYGSHLKTNAYFQYIDLWSSVFTWGGTTVPGEGELVVIQQSQTVYFDAKTPVLAGLIIIGGSLIFDDMQDVILQAQYIIIVANGTLQVGTEKTPFIHNANIQMYGNARSIELPIYGAKVIALRNGTLDMHGAPVGVTWTHLGETANQNDSEITLKEPVSWSVGSQIVIATTGDYESQGETEVRTIVNVTGYQITLDRPLDYSHLSENRTVNDTYVLIRAEVGLLTRNVLFNGKNI